MLFNAWLDWSKETMENKNKMNSSNERPVFMRPMGEKICPPWVRYDFNDLEDFYKYYKSLIIEE